MVRLQFEADCFKKHPGFLSCQLKTRVYPHKVLLYARKKPRGNFQAERKDYLKLALVN